MGKILGGIVFIAVAFTWLGVSASKDMERNIAHSECEKEYLDNGIPYETRETFISDCMDNQKN